MANPDLIMLIDSDSDSPSDDDMEIVGFSSSQPLPAKSKSPVHQGSSTPSSFDLLQFENSSYEKRDIESLNHLAATSVAQLPQILAPSHLVPTPPVRSKRSVPDQLFLISNRKKQLKTNSMGKKLKKRRSKIDPLEREKIQKQLEKARTLRKRTSDLTKMDRSLLFADNFCILMAPGISKTPFGKAFTTSVVSKKGYILPDQLTSLSNMVSFYFQRDFLQKLDHARLLNSNSNARTRIEHNILHCYRDSFIKVFPLSAKGFLELLEYAPHGTPSAIKDPVNAVPLTNFTGLPPPISPFSDLPISLSTHNSIQRTWLDRSACSRFTECVASRVHRNMRVVVLVWGLQTLLASLFRSSMKTREWFPSKDLFDWYFIWLSTAFENVEIIEFDTEAKAVDYLTRFSRNICRDPRKPRKDTIFHININGQSTNAKLGRIVPNQDDDNDDNLNRSSEKSFRSFASQLLELPQIAETSVRAIINRWKSPKELFSSMNPGYLDEQPQLENDLDTILEEEEGIVLEPLHHDRYHKTGISTYNRRKLLPPEAKDLAAAVDPNTGKEVGPAAAIRIHHFYTTDNGNRNWY